MYGRVCGHRQPGRQRSTTHNPTAIRWPARFSYHRDVPGPDEDDRALDDFFELGEITEPGCDPSSEPDLALGSDIHEVPTSTRDRAPLDGIDAVLVAYLLDLGDPSPAADRGHRVVETSTRHDDELEVDKPERGE